MSEQPTIIKGGLFADNRGSIRFVNDFTFPDIKRFYLIKHTDPSVVRAWQGHRHEKKYFYPIKGSFLVAWVKLDDFEHPSNDLLPEYHLLTASNSEILSLPGGYANGLKAIEPNSELLIFSNKTLEDSEHDHFQYPAEWWLEWSGFTWNTDNAD